jgi:F-type H+-transporting ATPase subunit gamma
LTVNLNEDESEGVIDYIYEPGKEAILDELLPLYLKMQLWSALLESNASEQGARMAAMDNATENAKELEQELRLKYNQARQSAITTEISEIVSGAQALQGN